VPDAGLKSSSCMAHALQRTIVNSINTSDVVKEKLRLFKGFVKGTRQSHVQLAYLTEAQKKTGVFPHRLVQPNSTRSVFVMGECG
jgi:hypothetical protein